MKIKDIHSLHMTIKEFHLIQIQLRKQIYLHPHFSINKIDLCAGVDIAYWKVNKTEFGICSIVVIDYRSKKVIEKKSSISNVTTPYKAEYLALRELPLIIMTAKKLQHTPDIFMFDGNGYLHPRHIGIATHASFFLNKPTIGVAKSYLKIRDVDFIMPDDHVGAYENIVIEDEVYGRVLRTRKNVKPIFISCGNYIDLQTTTKIILNLINNESRIPIPVRLADLETRHRRGSIIDTPIYHK